MARRTKDFHGCCNNMQGRKQHQSHPQRKCADGSLDNYLEYVWRPVGHERRVSAEEWWCKREYLWPRVATIARRHLATQASSACSERSFSKVGLICGRKRMMLKPEHVDALSMLGWHAMHEKELLKQGE